MQGKVGMDIWDESTLVDIALDRCVYVLLYSWSPTDARLGPTLPYAGATSVARRVLICGCVPFAAPRMRC